MQKKPAFGDKGPQIPLERRPLAFATTELILDLLYVARDRFSGDYERMLIYFCTAHARESGVTRREISATTELARETVRRKVAQMLAAGELKIGQRGRLYAAADQSDPHVAAFNREAKRAAQSYARRVARFGVTLD